MESEIRNERNWRLKTSLRKTTLFYLLILFHLFLFYIEKSNYGRTYVYMQGYQLNNLRC